MASADMRAQESRKQMSEMGCSGPNLDLAVAKYPDALSSAIDYYFTLPAPDSADVDMASSESNNFSKVGDGASQDGKEMVRFSEISSTNLPSNPPPSPKFGPLTLSDSQKGKVIDLTTEDSDPDALERALQMSMEDQPVGFASSCAAEADVTKAGVASQDDYSRAVAASMVDAVPQDAAFSKPPAQQVRSDMSTPVILRSSAPNNPWLGPLLQCFYACTPFRDALLALEINHEPYKERAPLFDQYWRGEATWEVLNEGGPSASASAYARISALQRLFAFVTYTRRRLVALDDVEHAWQLRDRQLGTDPVSGAVAFGGALEHAWSTFADLRYAAEIAEGQQEEEAQRKRKELVHVLLHLGTMCTPSLEPLAGEGQQSVAALDVGVSPGMTSLQEALDGLFTTPIAQKLPIILETAEAAAFNLKREQAQPDFDRKPISLPFTLYLDRYVIAHRERILERRERRKTLVENRAAIEKKRVLVGSRRNLTALKVTIEYLTDHARPLNDAARQRQEYLRRRLTETRDFCLGRTAHYDAELASVDAEVASLFDTPDMQTLGPYNIVAAFFWDGLAKCHAYIWDQVEGKAWKVAQADVLEVGPAAAMEDRAGVHMSAGAITVIYSRPSSGSMGEALPVLREAVEADNEAFARELPDEVTASWRQDVEMRDAV